LICILPGRDRFLKRIEVGKQRYLFHMAVVVVGCNVPRKFPFTEPFVNEKVMHDFFKTLMHILLLHKTNCSLAPAQPLRLTHRTPWVRSNPGSEPLLCRAFKKAIQQMSSPKTKREKLETEEHLSKRQISINKGDKKFFSARIQQNHQG